MVKKISQNELEKILISKVNRYQLSSVEFKQLKKIFKGKNILVTGACGSIGSAFTNELLNYPYKKVYLLDKDENNLTEMNRSIVLKKKNNIEYICTDLNIFNLDQFLLENKIQIYLNFAAVKHVRSEENFESTKYMIKTNVDSFCPQKKNFLKIFFSISSDKSINPHSILGISKHLMELKLMEYSKKYPSVHVASTRFANVAFSRGSYLEYVLNRIEKKIIFGVPMNISRYFITKKEAVSLCLLCLISSSKNKIIIPKIEKLQKEVKLIDLVRKILKIKNYKLIFSKTNKKIKNNIFPIVPQYDHIIGQKNYEEFMYDKEKKIGLLNGKVDYIKFNKNIKKVNIVKVLIATKNKSEMIKKIKKKFKFFNPRKKSKNISKLL